MKAYLQLPPFPLVTLLSMLTGATGAFFLFACLRYYRHDGKRARVPI